MNMKDLIQSEYREEGGYWIDLKPGWCWRGEWTHSIVEDTKRQAYRTLRSEVVKCECKECTA